MQQFARHRHDFLKISKPLFQLSEKLGLKSKPQFQLSGINGEIYPPPPCKIHEICQLFDPNP